MSTAPRWSPVDDDTADLLTLVADGPAAVDTDVEWDCYVQALFDVALANGGLVWPNALRPRVRDKVAPQRIGAFAKRALSRKLVEYTGEWELSDDAEGRNGGKPARVMRWLGGVR